MLQESEAKILVESKRDEWEQRVIAASVPHGYESIQRAMLYLGYEQELQNPEEEESDILFPSSPEEFEEMMKLFE